VAAAAAVVVVSAAALALTISTAARLQLTWDAAKLPERLAGQVMARHWSYQRRAFFKVRREK
jgi:hypothetical protein